MERAALVFVPDLSVCAAMVIGQIPKGYFVAPNRFLFPLAAFLVQAPVNSQSQFYQKINVIQAGRHCRPLYSRTFQVVRWRHRPRNGRTFWLVRRSNTRSASRGTSPTATLVWMS